MSAGAEGDAEPAMTQAAAESSIAVCWCRLEPDADRWRVVAYVNGPDGELLLRYVRAHPATGDIHPILHGTAVAPGDSLGLTEVLGVRVGIAICSELWLPEAVRTLAVRGAELILAPAGGGFGKVAENWRLIARARAIENNFFVGMTHSRYGGEPCIGLIAGPEEVVADGEGSEDELVVAELDLARARWLRGIDDSMKNPKPFSSLPGLVRAARPELYADLSADRPGSYDYGRAGEGASGS
ncbi:MAG: carbon-nitrogen hydrolase family protein, partial [Solirubrobacterales bacterium]